LLQVDAALLNFKLSFFLKNMFFARELVKIKEIAINARSKAL